VRILNDLGCPDETELSITIVGDRTIRRLNRDYLGKDRSTNVISFPQQEGEHPALSQVLGDVVISADTADREAQTAGWNGYERLIFLLLHGILHLNGYDHERSGEAEARKMRRKELQIWKLLKHEGLAHLPAQQPK